MYPVVEAVGNVWSAVRLQAKSLLRMFWVCANVSVNKGEGVVKSKDVLPLPEQRP